MWLMKSGTFGEFCLAHVQQSPRSSELATKNPGFFA
jgi:hypothetical protein